MVATRHQDRIRGFSLIELLIATTIAGLVIGLATYSFGLFSRGWLKFSGGYGEASAQLQRLELVEAAVEAAVPWIVKDDTGKPGYYFLGREEGLTLVTSRAVFSASQLAVIRLFREREDGGTFRLVYEEAPLDDLLLERADQILPFSRRVVVVRGLAGLTFRYFGWENNERFIASLEDSSSPPLWFDNYDGLVRGLHPSRVGIGVGGNETVYNMPDRGGFSSE